MGLLATLRHYWKTSVAVALSAAATTAVLTGALVVGDSMRGSLRDLALDRLGSIENALLSESFFREGLAPEWVEASGEATFAPAVLLRGSASAPDSGRRATKVQIQGIDESFAALYSTSVSFERGEGQRFPSVLLNQALADELAVEVGDDVLLALAKPSDVPRESLMGSTDPSDLVQTLRVSVRDILPNRGLGRFSLEPIQSMPLNAYVELDVLQSRLDQDDRINAVFVVAAEDGEGADLESALGRTVELGDLGVHLTVGPEAEEMPNGEELLPETPSDVVHLESREIVFRPAVEDVLLKWAEEQDAELFRVSSYLANRTVVVGRNQDDGRLLPYSSIAGADLGHDGFGDLRWLAGDPGPLETGEVVLNAWAAEDLEASVGDVLRIEYWEVGELEELIPREVELRLRGIVALEGLAKDPSLTPPFPGVHDADDMADWEPTFPVDLGLIRDRDEDYWDRYRATPKLFVSMDQAGELWKSRFGWLSALRVRFSEDGAQDGESPAEDPDAAELAAKAAEIERTLVQRIDPRLAGLAPVAVREQALAGAGGATDFGGLFLGFSMFLIAAAVLLSALFFRLGVEQRASEIGARLATGFPPKTVRRTFLKEGLLLGGLGSILGIALAVAFAQAMIVALGTRWASALGLEAGEVAFLGLHVQPQSLAIGAFASFLVTAFAVWRAVHRLERVSPVSLLRGDIRDASTQLRSGRRARWVLVIALPLTLICLALSTQVEPSQAAPVFFGAGALLLTSGLAAFALVLARRVRRSERAGLMGMPSMARVNASLYPGRSLLAVALVAAAAFVIVAVGSYGRSFGEEVADKDSGAGGFVIAADSDIPIYHDLGSGEGRFELGFSGSDDELFAGREVFALRDVPGDDVSCLNLYQPEKPRLLGVPSTFVARGGFDFRQVLGDDVENPWALLEEPIEPGVIPAIGDLNSVMWILKSGLGQDVEMENEKGETIRLRLVGLLHKSIFQSELIISEDQLLEHFPSRGGYRSFLVAAQGGVVSDEADGSLVEALESRLTRFGFDASGTAEKLEAFQAVENTYMGTFQSLGGLGLLLGTLGLGVVLLRSVLERVAELALLRAVGFRRRLLGVLVLAENGFLLLVGLLLGTVAALLAVAPHLASGDAVVPWFSLLGTLLVVFVVGLVASFAAAREAMRVGVLDGLRSE